MSKVIADRVWETSTTTGTADYVLLGAKTGFQSFSAVGDGNTCQFCATDGTNWETGEGVYTLSTTTLTRATIYASSNSGNKVSWAAGTRDVFVVIAAAANSVTGSAVSAKYFTIASGSISPTELASGAIAQNFNALNVASGLVTISGGLRWVGTNETLTLTANGFGDQLSCDRTIVANGGLQTAGGNGLTIRDFGPIALGAAGEIGWSASSDGAGTKDTGIARNMSGVIEINLGVSTGSNSGFFGGLVAADGKFINKLVVGSGNVNSGQIQLLNALAIASGTATVSGILFATLSSGAVLSGNIASGQIGLNHLANGSIQSGQIASGQVFTFHIASGGILSGGIGSGQIGLNHIASGAVRSGHIASGQVATFHIASGGVG